MLTVLNKADLLAGSPEELEQTLPEARAADSVVVSARNGWNLAELQERIEAMLERSYERVRVRIPYDRAALVDLFHRKGSIAAERHTETGTLITGSLPSRYAGPFRPYVERQRR
jgi:50S ribosomal subunit-associated GTPase HflX